MARPAARVAEILGRTPQGLIVQGTFSGQTQLQCVRCLTDFLYPLHWEFTELYAFNKRSLTESELLLPDDAQIDLQPVFHQPGRIDDIAAGSKRTEVSPVGIRRPCRY